MCVWIVCGGMVMVYVVIDFCFEWCIVLKVMYVYFSDDFVF